MSSAVDTTIQNSIKWSGLAEICAKLIIPVSTILLARILSPDAFGVLAVCNLLISFSEIISDAGFGKYIVQTDFADDRDRDACANVAFWSHFILSAFICTVIIIFKRPIASLLGGEEYAHVIAIASLQLIIMSMISTQLGLLRRSFAFKKTFYVRICTALVPLCITVPLALCLKSYWALIIGNLCGSSVSVIVLFIVSDWRPSFYYSFDIFKRMFGFSFWSLCEGLTHWMIFWADTFIIGRIYSSYYVGLYKNSTQIIISAMGIVTASMSPVLLSVLSRIKDDRESYRVLLHIEKMIVYLLLPAGIGIFCYRQFITDFLLGEEWAEAANIIGVWALMMVVSIIIYSFPAEAFKAKGIPKRLFLYQLSYLAFLIPICIYTSRIGFWPFVYGRAGSIVIQVALFFFFVRKYLNWEIVPFLKMLAKPAEFALVVTILSYLFYSKDYTTLENILAIFATVVSSAAILFLRYKRDILLSLETIRENHFGTKQ